MIVPAVSLRLVSGIPLVFILGNFIISFQSRNDTGSQETADARNKKVIPAFLLPESRKAYGDRTTFKRKKGRWRAIAESKMAGSGLQQMRQTVKQLGYPVIENPGIQIPVL